MKTKPKIWIIPFDYKRLTPQTIQYLNQEEKQKAQSFFHQIDQKNYQLSHIYLRELLTQYSPPLPPEAWKFEFNSYGKPYIANQGYRDIYFNISHTKTHFAMIISDKECGIDIEKEGSIKIDQNILDLVLTPREQTRIREKNISFYALWTLKEAHLKAIGRGLSISLHDIEFLTVKKNKFFRQGDYGYRSKQYAPNLYLSYAINL